MEQITKLENVAHHRNGVCGTGFTVGIAECEVEGEENKKRTMLMIQFDPENCNKNLMQTAVLDLDLLKKENINFGENSWRGDRFADEFKDKSGFMLDKQHEELMKKLEEKQKQEK